MEILDGKYQIENILGEGGMGAVYRATHLGTKRTVAVKVIRPDLSAHPEFLARFQREAEAAGRLRHPNVVDVTDFGFAQTSRGRVAYLVMEYLDGCSLAEVASEEGALPVGWVVDILEQVSAAVEEAHKAGIIHRDLKPDNIWLEPNGRGGYTVKVLDFGLVKLLEDKPDSSRRDEVTTIASESDTILRGPRTNVGVSLRGRPFGDTAAESAEGVSTEGHPYNEDSTRIKVPDSKTNNASETYTRIGSVMGTPLYMSPEQCRGETLGSGSDIYSLGVIAYRLLTGETPFTGSFDELIEFHQTHEPTPIREKNPKVPRKMAQLISSTLSKDPKQRPSSAAGFAATLRASWEGTSHLLRHAFALYSEHFPTFFQISLLGYAPVILVLMFIKFGDKLIDVGALSYFQQVAFGVSVLLALIIALLFAYFIVSAATVPVVVQLVIVPLRAVHIKTALKALQQRWKIFAATSLLVVILILLGSLLFVVPGLIAAMAYALYAPVAIMERSGVRATLRRSRMLSRRAILPVLVITIIQFLLPVLVWRAAVTTKIDLQLGDDWSPKQFGFNFALSGVSMFYQLLNIFVTPLTAIMIALLYLKTRKAGGESFSEQSERFEALEMPRSQWQARMRSRSRSSAFVESKSD